MVCVDDGQGGLACCDSWVGKESDTTERLIRSELTNRRQVVRSRELSIVNDKLEPFSDFISEHPLAEF